MLPRSAVCALLLALIATPAFAASSAFDGAALPVLWGLPFAGLLLSIAIVPLVAPQFWHAHFGKVALAWTVALLVPFALQHGSGETVHHLAHALVREYFPFVSLLFALYVIAGGISIRGRTGGTPARNTALLALGASLASVMGTTGAAMLLIRPLLASNEHRRHRVHAVVFFILLAGNVGGALSPLGDPPLFIGYLKGIDFFWTTRALLWPTLGLCAALLLLFYLLDWRLDSRERAERGFAFPTDAGPLRIEGGFNFLLLAAVIGAILMSGLWNPGVTFDVLGTPLPLEILVRDVALFGLALVSLLLTPAAVREHNVFHWGPIIEVAKLFAAIFVTIFPVLAILQAGKSGALAGVVALVSASPGVPDNFMVFWVTGVLSGFLDNAPTYLVFFSLAGGDPVALMGPLATTLKAISMAAVYFGALTYIGNAPNFMIKAIAEDRGVPMPSFFAYMAYTSVLMLPLLVVVSLVAL